MRLPAALCAAAILVIVVLANTGSLPPWLRSIYDVPGGDKLGHLILFGLLNFMITWDRVPRGYGPLVIRRLVRPWLLLAAVIGVEEFSQMFLPRRNFDLGDLLASYMGLALGACLVLWLRHKRPH